jgi:hypothetical protein
MSGSVFVETDFIFVFMLDILFNRSDFAPR